VDEGEDVLDEAAFLGDESAASTPGLPPRACCCHRRPCSA